MQLSLVIPLYNEVESLPELTAWIERVVQENGYSYEILFVDDGSKDGSWKEIQRLRKANPAVRGIRFQRNYGKSAALQVGFEAVQGDVVITMDADLQDSPDEIPFLYRMVAEKDWDVVSGWKKQRHDPISKTIPSRFFNAVTRWVSGIHLHDFNCGLKAYRKDVVKNIEIYGEMHRYIPLLAKYAGFDHIAEKVVEHRARKYGKTKFGLNRFINGFLDLITLVVTQRYLKKPMHFFGTWGVLFSFLGAATLAYLAFIRLVWNIWISNRMPALIFGAVMFTSGVVLFSTGLLAELFSRNSSTRNQYRISERAGE
jgi:glycosyltransferase involved in cell wall biosynthesis